MGNGSSTGDTLEINYPADSAYGKGLFELRGDTLLLRHLRNGRPGKRIRLIRGLMTWNDLHPPAPEPPPIDSFANVRFDYPKHWRPSPPRDVGILTDLHTFEEYDRFERSHGGVRDEVANIGVNLYVYPYAASHYMGLVNNYNRPDRKDRVLRSMYMHSLPDRYLRSIYYELAPTTEYGDPASQVAKQGNAQFDRVSDFLTTKFGPPLEIDSTPRPTVDKGRTFWHRQGHWKSNGREALLRLSVSGGYDVNAVIYCE